MVLSHVVNSIFLPFCRDKTKWMNYKIGQVNIGTTTSNGRLVMLLFFFLVSFKLLDEHLELFDLLYVILFNKSAGDYRLLWRPYTYLVQIRIDHNDDNGLTKLEHLTSYNNVTFESCLKV